MARRRYLRSGPCLSIFDMFHRPLGWYCSYCAAQLVTGTSKWKENKTSRMRGRARLYTIFFTMFNRWLSVLRIWTDKPIHTYCISDVATNGDAQMNEWRKEKDVFLSLSVNVMFFSQRKTDSPLQLQLQNDPKNTLFCNILLIFI